MRTTRHALISKGIITHIIEIPDRDVGRMGTVWERLARKYGGGFVMLPFGGQVGDAVRVNQEGVARVTVTHTWHPQATALLDGGDRIVDGNDAKSGAVHFYDHDGAWRYIEPSLVDHYRCDLGREVIAVDVE